MTVPVQHESDDRLVVVTPAHPAGTVDVVVTVSGEEPVRLPNAFTFDGGAEAAYEAVLLPVHVDGTVDGSHGTKWQTDLWIRNNGADHVMIAPWICPGGQACPPVVPLTYNLLPRLSLHNLPAETQAGNISRVLYVHKAQAENVSFSLRLTDVSRNPLNGGTDLPVIREDELLVRPSQLFNIPLNHDFRVVLRVYDLAYTTSRFRVTLYPQSTADEQPVHVVELTAASGQTGGFRTDAAYAQLDITDLLRLERTWPQAVRVEIAPLTPGSRYWAFASLTNNATQLVTLVSPQ